MSGHGPIYDWKDYDTSSLKKMLKASQTLKECGLDQDEDFLYSIQQELSSRVRRKKE